MRRPFVWALAALTSLLVVVPAAAADPTTLNIDLQSGTDWIDPALDYYQLGWEIEYATCAKLVNYPDLGGPAGAVLQPEVALALPVVSDGGRTYTFQLRDDFRFDTGEKVTAKTFVHVFERLRDPAELSPATPFFADVTGIEAQGQTLTFHLAKPSGTFLSRLTLPFTCAVPLNAPIDPNNQTPLASAGPYRIASYDRTHQIVLERNPNYHAGRPARFDRFVFTIGTTPDAALQRVESGQSDFGADENYTTSYQRLWDQYGPDSPAAALGFQQFFVNPLLDVEYLGLNTSRPLFSDPTVRKAVNLALDRPALIAANGAFSGVATDQILAPGLDGFQDADLYPLNGPDVAAARALMAGRTATAVLYTSTRPAALARAAIIQQDLAAIGITVEVHAFSRGEQIQREGTRGEPFDMTTEGWYDDYPDAWDTLFLLDGRRIGPTNNRDASYFDDRAFNRALDKADRKTGSARAAALAALDVSTMRDAAPWAPIADAAQRDLFSHRIGCQVFVPAYTMDLGALCDRTRPVNDPPAPSTRKAPTVTLTGGVVTCNVGTWMDATTFAFGWTRNGKTVTRATGLTYTVKPRDAGHPLACVVTARNLTGATTATSAAVTP